MLQNLPIPDGIAQDGHFQEAGLGILLNLSAQIGADTIACEVMGLHKFLQPIHLFI